MPEEIKPEAVKLDLAIDSSRPFRLNTAYCIPGTSDYLQDRTYQPGELTDEQIALIPPNYLNQNPEPQPEPEVAAATIVEPPGATTTTKRTTRSQTEATTGE